MQIWKTPYISVFALILELFAREVCKFLNK